MLRNNKSSSRQQSNASLTSSLSVIMKEEFNVTNSSSLSEPVMQIQGREPSPTKLNNEKISPFAKSSQTFTQQGYSQASPRGSSHAKSQPMMKSYIKSNATSSNVSFLRELNNEVEKVELPRNLSGSNSNYNKNKNVHTASTSVISSTEHSTSYTICAGEVSKSNVPVRMIIPPYCGHKSGSTFPVLTSTYIPYAVKKEVSDEESSSTATPVSAIGSSVIELYEDVSNRRFFTDSAPNDKYDPLFLDDPDIRSCRQKKVMAMKGLLTSTIPFVKHIEMKKDLDDQFKEKHQSWFNKKTELTLSMIRLMKRSIISCMELFPVIEVATVAYAIVYFEKLVLQNLVTKLNRKSMAATCLFIAFKFTIDSGGSDRKVHFDTFYDRIEHEFGISKKVLMQKEFSVLSHLKFDIKLKNEEWVPHVEYIRRQINGDEIESLCESIVNNNKLIKN